MDVTRQVQLLSFSLLLVLAGLVPVRAQQLVLAPGPSSSASLIVTITNNGVAVADTPELIASLVFFVETTMAVSSPCTLTQSTYSVRIAAPSLLPGASVSCTLTYTRNAASPIPSSYFEFVPVDRDEGLIVVPSNWIVGAMTDLALRVRPVRPLPRNGASEALFRVILSNPSDSAVSGAHFGRCADMGASPFRLDGDFPGGCPVSDVGMLCFMHSEFSFKLPSAPARGESSCLIRAGKSSGLIAGEGTDLQLESFFAYSGTGYWVADSSFGNDVDEFVVTFERAVPVPVSGRMGLFVLLLGFVALAWRRG